MDIPALGDVASLQGTATARLTLFAKAPGAVMEMTPATPTLQLVNRLHRHCQTKPSPHGAWHGLPAPFL